MPSSRYRIKEGKDEGFGRFHLYQDHSWVSTHQTREEAEAEMASWERFELSKHKPTDRRSRNTQDANYEPDEYPAAKLPA